nr:hypothetical protein [Tanacetum cinerariifolium]
FETLFVSEEYEPGKPKLDLPEENREAGFAGQFWYAWAPPQVTQFGSTDFTGAGVVDGVRVEDWFFLSKSNALTMSLSSATSDEMTEVDELVPTLATTALARV